MNKKIIVLLPLTLLLGACSNKKSETENITPSPTDKTSYFIKYDKNYPEAGAPTKFVVSKDKNPAKPADPIRNGYVFDGWYLEKDGKNAFDNFEKPLTSDVTLYAKWVDISTLSETDTISYLNKKIASYCGKPSKTSMQSSGLIEYYILSEPVAMQFESLENYIRYEDILTSTLFGKDENNDFTNVVSNTQTLYDNDHLYYLEENFEDKQGTIEVTRDKKTFPLTEAGKESMFDISFYNLAMGEIDNLEKILKKENTNELIPKDDNDPDFDPITYEISLDKLTNTGSFNFKINFNTMTKPKQDDPSASLQKIYSADCTIHFEDKMIRKAVIESNTLLGLGNQPLQYIKSVDAYDFDNVSPITKFEGTRFNPTDFVEKEN